MQHSILSDRLQAMRVGTSVNDEDETGPGLASNLISRSLIVRIVGDMTGPDKGQWYEMTAAGWDLYWKMQKSRTVGGTGRQDQSFAIK